jgi:hypothetical protein
MTHGLSVAPPTSTCSDVNVITPIAKPPPPIIIPTDETATVPVPLRTNGERRATK